jgi:hypothetical protein
MSEERIASAGAITPAHISELVTILTNLPIGQLVALFEGGVTVDSLLSLLEQAVSVIGTVDPLVAIPAEGVVMGLQALQFLLDEAGVGTNPITGGEPPSVIDDPGLGPTPNTPR